MFYRQLRSSVIGNMKHILGIRREIETAIAIPLSCSPVRSLVSIVACIPQRVAVDRGVTFSWGGLEALLHPNKRCFRLH